VLSGNTLKSGATGTASTHGDTPPMTDEQPFERDSAEAIFADMRKLSKGERLSLEMDLKRYHKKLKKMNRLADIVEGQKYARPKG
jgi:hypothetical protein